jgi:Protein of unknown function (DUF559)
MAAVLACGCASGGVGRAIDPPYMEPRRRRHSGHGFPADGQRILDHWGAAVSHCSAAMLWGLIPSRPGHVDISVAGDGGRAKRSGIRLHRCPSLSTAVVTLHRGIPVTTPARTIADLRRAVGRASGVTAAELGRAVRQAAVLGIASGEDTGSDRTRSDLERRFLGLCRRFGLPLPEVNVRVGSIEVDFLWRDRMVVVETDGYRYHRGRDAFERDRARDLELRARGFQVVRLSHSQVVGEQLRTARVLAMVLRRD